MFRVEGPKSGRDRTEQTGKITMALSPKCRVGDCSRNEAATVIADELPGPLQLCFAHTEQYRQNSEGWRIEWDAGASEPTSVFAPSTWGARRDVSAPALTPEPKVGRGSAGRLRGWTRASRRPGR